MAGPPLLCQTAKYSRRTVDSSKEHVLDTYTKTPYFQKCYPCVQRAYFILSNHMFMLKHSYGLNLLCTSNWENCTENCSVSEVSQRRKELTYVIVYWHSEQLNHWCHRCIGKILRHMDILICNIQVRVLLLFRFWNETREGEWSRPRSLDGDMTNKGGVFLQLTICMYISNNNASDGHCIMFSRLNYLVPCARTQWILLPIGVCRETKPQLYACIFLYLWIVRLCKF